MRKSLVFLQIRFIASRGNGLKGDISKDNKQVAEGQCCWLIQSPLYGWNTDDTAKNTKNQLLSTTASRYIKYPEKYFQIQWYELTDLLCAILRYMYLLSGKLKKSQWHLI